MTGPQAIAFPTAQGPRPSAAAMCELRRTVLVLSPVTGGFYYGDLLLGINREIAMRDHRMIVVQTFIAGIDPDTHPEPPDFDRELAWELCDGVIVLEHSVPAAHVSRLAATGKPAVMISGTAPVPDVPVITPDNARGVMTAVEHLIGHGHSRIGFVGHLRHAGTLARYESYRRVMAAHGLETGRELVVDTQDNARDGGVQAARAIAAGHTGPTAVLVATDRSAIAMLAELRRLGVRVPEELAVIGFDGVEDGALTEPALTSIAQSFGATGALAARTLLARIDGDAPPQLRDHPATGPTMVLRESCGCSARSGATGESEPLEWKRHATRLIRARTAVERSLREQHAVSIALLGGLQDPRDLDWLANVEVTAGLLALADGDATTLAVAGVYQGRHGLEQLRGLRMAEAAFPPRPLVSRCDPHAGETVFLVPIATQGADIGVLAFVGSITSRAGRDHYDNWATLLRAAFEREELTAAVHAERERYALVMHATHDGLWDWDVATGTTYLSERCKELLGYGDQRLRLDTGLTPWLDLVHPDDLPAVTAALDRAMATPREPVEIEHRVRSSSGDYRWLVCRAMADGRPDGRLNRMVGALADIDDKKTLEQHLRIDALYDMVTGLPNRRLFFEHLTAAIGKHTRTGVAFAVIFVDLDDFKMINDSLGHTAGDQILTRVGQWLVDAVRPGDVVARFGGDEFAVLMQDVDDAALLDAVHGVQRALGRSATEQDHGFQVRGSIGIATSRTRYTTAEEVLRDADIAMYHAKANNRGGFSFFTSEMHARAVEQLRFQSALQRAVEHGELEVHYQPVVRLEDGYVDRFEALLRWRHPTRGLMYPGQFMAQAEEAALMVTIGDVVIEQVCAQIAEWRRSYSGPLNVAVNLSHAEFWQNDLAAKVTVALRRHGVGAGEISLEITERVIMRSPARAAALIHELHAAGFALFIDDFGTGNSPLQMLQECSVEALKLDRSFVEAVRDPAQPAALVDAIINLARALGTAVIAEGIETEAQLAYLRAAGCRVGQGHLFSAAITGEQAGLVLGTRLPPRGGPASRDDRASDGQRPDGDPRATSVE